MRKQRQVCKRKGGIIGLSALAAKLPIPSFKTIGAFSAGYAARPIVSGALSKVGNAYTNVKNRALSGATKLVNNKYFKPVAKTTGLYGKVRTANLNKNMREAAPIKNIISTLSPAEQAKITGFVPKSDFEALAQKQNNGAIHFENGKMNVTPGDIAQARRNPAPPPVPTVKAPELVDGRFSRDQIYADYYGNGRRRGGGRYSSYNFIPITATAGGYISPRQQLAINEMQAQQAYEAQLAQEAQPQDLPPSYAESIGFSDTIGGRKRKRVNKRKMLRI